MSETDTTTPTIEEIAERFGVHPTAVSDWIDWIGCTPEEAANDRDGFFDAFVGEISAEEYAEELVSEYAVPEWLVSHIDYESIANDLLMDGYYESPGGYLFRSY